MEVEMLIRKTSIMAEIPASFKIDLEYCCAFVIENNRTYVSSRLFKSKAHGTRIVFGSIQVLLRPAYINRVYLAILSIISF